MSLQFIAGGSGSGKTRYLYEKVIKESEEHPDIQYLFIVPEQYTMQTQKELVRLHPRHGLLNIDVLSFKRLAYDADTKGTRVIASGGRYFKY